MKPAMATAAASKKEDKKEEGGAIWALLAYVLHIVGALFVLVFKKDKHFAVYHAKQSLVLCLSWVASFIVISIVMALLSFVSPLLALLGLVILMPLNLVFIILLVIGIFNALLGRQRPLPLIGKLAEGVQL